MSFLESQTSSSDREIVAKEIPHTDDRRSLERPAKVFRPSPLAQRSTKQIGQEGIENTTSKVFFSKHETKIPTFPHPINLDLTTRDRTSSISYNLAQRAFCGSSENDMLHLQTEAMSVSEKITPSHSFLYLIERPQELVLTEEIINRFNENIGRQEDRAQIELLIAKMRRLGGLDELAEGDRLDIPSARIGLCLLSALNTEEYKLSALKSLLGILEKDDNRKPSADQLIPLTIKLAELMDRNLVQATTIDVQMSMAKVYHLLVEKLLIHYHKEHINGITRELKRALKQTALALGKLNRNENISLKFHLKSAVKGIHLLVDDEEQLVTFLTRLYNLSAAATSFYMNDTLTAFPKLELALRDVDIELSSSWYNSTLIIQNLEHKILEEKIDIKALLMFIEHKKKTLNWRFSYAAVLTLYRICLHGKTDEVKLKAFKGLEIQNELGETIKIPGLRDFLHLEDLPGYRSWGPIKHFKRPQKVNPNPRIQEICADCLASLLHVLDTVVSEETETLLKAHRLLRRDSSPSSSPPSSPSKEICYTQVNTTV